MTVASLSRRGRARVRASRDREEPFPLPGGAGSGVESPANTEGRMAAAAIPVIHPAEARTTVQVFLPDGRVIEGPRGTQLAAFLEQCTDLPAPAVGAGVNGELRELNYTLEMDARLRPATMGGAG